MMNFLDMRLLEKAVAAAGYKAVRWNDDQTALLLDGEQEPWNPLADDGAALRLAVRVNLELCIASPISYARMAMQEGITAPISEFHRADAMAATRRAIVRAAAALAVDENGRPNGPS